MNKFTFTLSLLLLLTLSACGGGGDASKFCECMTAPTESCTQEMEKLEEEFKKDPERLKTFLEDVGKECPDMKDIAERLK